MKRVFLGGTTKGPDWRKELIDKLEVEYFNPIVDNWDEEARLNEQIEKKICTHELYVITPFMGGFYSIAEAVDRSNKEPGSVLFCVLDKVVTDKEIRTFTRETKHSLDAVCNMIKDNGSFVFDSLESVVDWLNK